MNTIVWRGGEGNGASWLAIIEIIGQKIEAEKKKLERKMNFIT